MNTGQRQGGQLLRDEQVGSGCWGRCVASATLAVSAFLLLAATACGESPAGAPSSLEPISTSVSTAAAEAGSVAHVFAEMAAAAAPMTVYGLAELPDGATVPADWWPIVDVETPAEYTGPPTANPRVIVGREGDAEAQLVVEYQGGWLAFLQNFRGDLGDVQGEDVGAVDGHPASLYEVNGGVLVQWRDSGRWYGVFARGVSPDEVSRVALQMRAMELPTGR